MAGGDRTTTRLGRFREPRWRDPAFWVAAGITAIAFAVQVAVAPDRSGWLVWLGLAARLVLTWVIISSLIRIRVGLGRGLVRGYTEAERRHARAAPGSERADVVGRASGRLAGRALRAYWSRKGGQ